MGVISADKQSHFKYVNKGYSIKANWRPWFVIYTEEELKQKREEWQAKGKVLLYDQTYDGGWLLWKHLHYIHERATDQTSVDSSWPQTSITWQLKGL